MIIHIDQLQDTIKTKMMRKFGTIVDFDEMEVYILRKAVADQEMNRTVNDVDDEKYIKFLEVNYFCFTSNVFGYKFRHFTSQEKLKIRNEELCSLKQKRIENFNILTTLHEEVNAINTEHKYNLKMHQQHSRWEETRSTIAHDLERLVNISNRQKIQIKQIVDDIREMRLKSNVACSVGTPLDEDI